MTVVDWDESFSVGSPEIDADHRLIIALLNDLHDAYQDGQPPATIASLFERLVRATTQHCRREEALLAARRYEAIDDQHAEHRLLIEALETLPHRLAGKPSAEVAAEVSDYLLNWFMSHILEEDMKFRSMFRSQD